MTKTNPDKAAAVGNVIKLDGWSCSADPLLPGDDFSAFRLPVLSRGPIKSLAVNVEITGRVPRRDAGLAGAYRCRLTFVGDGEPDEVVGGYIWMTTN